MENNNATLPKLTVDIFNHPNCPEEAKWAAVDECGDAYVYETKPIKQSEDWHTDEGGDFVGEYDPADWQSSLIERPTAKESAIKDLGKAIECLQNEIEYIKENWEK